jgi:hypothetical protein
MAAITKTATAPTSANAQSRPPLPAAVVRRGIQRYLRRGSRAADGHKVNFGDLHHNPDDSFRG